jgi:hypothetical protein
MTVKQIIIFLTLYIQLSFTKNKKSIAGIITYNRELLYGIEVFNLNSKTTSKTNNTGAFTLLVEAKYLILYVFKKYFYKKTHKKKRHTE